MGIKTTAAVSVSGDGFQPGASLSFVNGAGPAPRVSNVVVHDGTLLTARVRIKRGGPRKTRYWDVVVSNPDGTTDVLTGGLTVDP